MTERVDAPPDAETPTPDGRGASEASDRDPEDGVSIVGSSLASASTSEEEDASTSEEEDDGRGASEAASSDGRGASGASDRDPVARWLRRLGPVLAGIIALVGLGLWWQAGNDDALAAAIDRDNVLIEATQAIETMNTLDYQDVDDGLDSWLDVTTGTLHDQLASVGDDERQLLADQGKVSTGHVVDAAVLDLDGDTATVIASVEVSVVDGESGDAEPSIKRNRFSADLVRVNDRWLLENLQQVAVSIS